MLHSCDAGEKSIISVYPVGFEMSDPSNGYSDFKLIEVPPTIMRFYNFRTKPEFGITDRKPVIGVRVLNFNSDKMVKPFESPWVTANMNFSHGHFILNAGYREEYENVFSWEEDLLTYFSWKAGYKTYAVND